MNLLVDTNVLIDYLGRKAPFFDDAKRLVATGYFGDAQLWIPAQSAKDAFYVLNHYIDSARIQEALLNAFEILKPVSLGADDLLRAARLRWKDYEDCLVALCAEHVAADYIVTRDIRGFVRASVPTITPSKWLAEQEKRGISYEEIIF